MAGLSWELFEAFVAEIYSRDAREVILTLRSVDHGCDVVVSGHDRAGYSLVQGKHTTARGFDGNVAIREVASSRAHYEHRLEPVMHFCRSRPCRAKSPETSQPRATPGESCPIAMKP